MVAQEGQPKLLHSPQTRNFVNPAFFAANVMEIEIPLEVMAPLQALVPHISRLDTFEGAVTVGEGLNLYVAHPTAWQSDIRWISHDDEPSFTWFEDIFHALDVAQHVAPFVDCEQTLTLYASFFLTRSRCAALNMHVDWSTGQNDAFTLLAPLTANCADMGLSYLTMRGEQREYTYQLGKALLFGDHFYHSTAVGHTDEPTVFLAMNFGTDRMDNWDQLVATTGNQGDFYRRPDGAFIRRSALSKEERLALKGKFYSG